MKTNNPNALRTRIHRWINNLRSDLTDFVAAYKEALFTSLAIHAGSSQKGMAGDDWKGSPRASSTTWNPNTGNSESFVRGSYAHYRQVTKAARKAGLQQRISYTGNTGSYFGGTPDA